MVNLKQTNYGHQNVMTLVNTTMGQRGTWSHRPLNEEPSIASKNGGSVPHAMQGVLEGWNNFKQIENEGLSNKFMTKFEAETS